jgi:hypothetical protein
MCKAFNAETFQCFLKRLLRRRTCPRRMIVVLSATSPRSAKCSRPSTPVSIAGVGKAEYCAAYAALLKALHLDRFIAG